jgi:hypothetical protein
MGDAKAHNFSQTAAVLEMRNEDEEIEKFLREEEAWLRKKREREKFWDSVRQELKEAKQIVGRTLYAGIANVSFNVYTLLKLQKIPALSRMKDNASKRYQAYMTGGDAQSQNDSDTESVHSYSTSGDETKDRIKKCGHYCSLWRKDRCCACADARPVNPANKYMVYVDGVGIETDNEACGVPRHAHYCFSCRFEEIYLSPDYKPHVVRNIFGLKQKQNAQMGSPPRKKRKKRKGKYRFKLPRLGGK